MSSHTRSCAPKPVLSGVVLCLGLAVASPTRADDPGGSPGAPKVPTSTTEKATPEKAKAPATTASAPDQRAQAGLGEARTRSERAKADGKPELAKRLDALARQWKRLAEALVRAAEAEARAAEVEREALELDAKAKRAVALVEQTEARRSRALGRLEELGLEGATTDDSARSAEPTGKEPTK